MDAAHSPFPPSSQTVIIRRFEAPVAMTWAAIELDRIARGLDLPPAAKAPKAKRAAKSTGPRMVDGLDARLPSNLTPCTAPAAAAKPTTAAQAASMRRKAMAVCSCRLCNLALHPALTFAEHAAFMGGDLQAEHWLATHQGERKLTTHDPDRETLNAYRATLAREAAHGTIFTSAWSGGTSPDYMKLGIEGSIAATKVHR